MGGKLTDCQTRRPRGVVSPGGTFLVGQPDQFPGCPARELLPLAGQPAMSAGSDLAAQEGGQLISG